MPKSFVGPVINAKGMVYGPIEKFGVMFLFARFLDEGRYLVEEINPDGPRVILRREVGKGLERVEAAFAFNSSEARGPGYLDNCDLLVCWRNDWVECPCEVLELEVLSTESTPARPDLNRVVGVAHASQEIPSDDDSQETGSFEDNSEEELRRKFNQTIKEIDEKIKDLF